MRMGALSAGLLVFLGAVGCVRRDGRNSDCKWPTEIVSHAPDARHLSADAVFAEDLAIRYASDAGGCVTAFLKGFERSGRGQKQLTVVESIYNLRYDRRSISIPFKTFGCTARLDG